MKLELTFSEQDKCFATSLSDTSQIFELDMGSVNRVTEYIGGELYQGDYVVTPKVDAQTIPTKGKVMAEDVTVKEIPIFRTSNTSGGNTVYIAKEI